MREPVVLRLACFSVEVVKQLKKLENKASIVDGLFLYQGPAYLAYGILVRSTSILASEIAQPACNIKVQNGASSCSCSLLRPNHKFLLGNVPN